MPVANSTSEATDPGRIARQAIVVVHGQGEQRPMGTIRSFVETLWTFDRGLKLADPKPEPQLDNALPEPGANEPKKVSDRHPSWIVPDEKGDLFDIQRVTCPELAEVGRRTDFFELYYADLLNTTPLRTLWRWLKRLIWVDPRHVTAEMHIAWGSFWILSFVAMLLVAAAAYFGSRLGPDDLRAVLADPWLYPTKVIIVIMVALLVFPRLLMLLPTGAIETFAAWRARNRFSLADVPAAVPYLGMLLAVAVLLRCYGAFWSVLGLAIEIYVVNEFLLPYFGDAASYLSAQTETVESRQKLRERGLKLLRALQDDPEYDRVVVVSHSLGTVLAYDLLHILWSEAGPTKENPPGSAALRALAELDSFTKNNPTAIWDKDQVNEYQDLQWAFFDVLRQQKAALGQPKSKSGWKISDLVTMGSPLTSAQFLLADGPKDFERLKIERLMPTSPAQPYDDKNLTTYNLDNGKKVAHHGAVFSAVRWTNIYDPFHGLFWYGDAIGGKVAGPHRFGRGIADIPHEMDHFERWVPENKKAKRPVAGHFRPGWLLFSRIFTHNLYWTNISNDWDHPSPHVVTLRTAVGIDRKRPVPKK